MKKEDCIIYEADPESTVGAAISNSIEQAQKNGKSVITRLRGTECIVTSRTRLEDGISKFRIFSERTGR